MIHKIHNELTKLMLELETGIMSLDDDDQIPAVLIMRLAMKRVETIGMIMNNMGLKSEIMND